MGPAALWTTGDGRPPARRDLEAGGRGLDRRRDGQGGRRVQPTRRKVIGRSLLAALATIFVPMLVGLRPGPLADQEEARRDDRDHDLGRGRPAGARHHLRADQARGHRDRSTGQRRAGESSGAHGAEFQIEKAKAAIIVRWIRTRSRSPSRRTGRSAESSATPRSAPRRLSDQPVGAADPPPACPCHQSTFDLGDSGLVVFGPAARALLQTHDHDRRRGLPRRPSWFRRPDRPEPSSNGTPAVISKKAITDGPTCHHCRYRLLRPAPGAHEAAGTGLQGRRRTAPMG